MHVLNWVTANKMPLNFSKCTYMKFSLNRDATETIQNFKIGITFPSYYTKNGDKFPKIHFKFPKFRKFLEKLHRSFMPAPIFSPNLT